jgi:hypothetical protein
MTSFWTHAHPVQFAILFATNDRAGASAILEKQAQLRAQHPSFDVLIWTHATCRAETELYWGRPAAALRLIELDWPALSGIGYYVMKNLALFLRARAALGAAAELPSGAERARLLRRANAALRSLQRSNQPVTRASAQLVRASTAALQGRRKAALQQLEDASVSLDAAGGKLMAASARYCLGALLQDRAQGRALQTGASDVLTEEGIVEPLRWIAWTAPGFRTIIDAPHA